MTETRSIPYCTMSVFPSTVTDLVLIYESVTSSASVVRWLALYRRTFNFWILLRVTRSSMHGFCAYPWKMFADSVQMESAFRTKSVSTNPHLHRNLC
jgi:hypothetical protein